MINKNWNLVKLSNLYFRFFFAFIILSELQGMVNNSSNRGGNKNPKHDHIYSLKTNFKRTLVFDTVLDIKRPSPK